MKQKELTKTFMLISNWKHLVSMVYTQICCEGYYIFSNPLISIVFIYNPLVSILFIYNHLMSIVYIYICQRFRCLFLIQTQQRCYKYSGSFHITDHSDIPIQRVFTVRRISVSAYITLCTVVFTVRRISVSAYITLCTVVFTVRRKSVSIHITFCTVVFTVRRISVSAYITFCTVVFTVRRISVSANITFCAVIKLVSTAGEWMPSRYIMGY